MRRATPYAASRHSQHRRHGATARCGALAVAAVAALLVGVGMASQASAETIPMPRPAPRARNLESRTASAQPHVTLVAATTLAATSAAPKQAIQTTPPDPIIPDPRRNVPASIFQTFDANQKAAAAKVSAYLSSLSMLSGNFVQVGPDGSRSTGDFYIQKPGKVRFEYDAPSPIAMISDGQSLAVRDNRLATQDVYPLSQTPLRYLLSDRIDLIRDTNVVAITMDDLYISVTIEEKNALVGTSRMMLMLGVKDNQLKQWTITDPQGYDTTVAIYNLDTTRKPDPGLFKIDYTKYPTGSAN